MTTKLLLFCEPPTKPHYNRLLRFDPTETYSRLNIDAFKRVNKLKMEAVFPKIEGVCSCGCGIELTGKKTRWAEQDCSEFAHLVYSVISGHSDVIRRIRAYYIGGYFCEDCGKQPKYQPIELDHVKPVIFGGGGCWIDNYKFRCKKCHRIKTNKDFGYKN